ncbi:armadillo-type protein [Irpex rosettiformis]|uniref:Armadillo-type protein n=1 Tax=Irpex rosettiformis TaxID=378272 RepID=A0ACB8UHS5_9APHY|nr:armadillo-type protein [Irpex rosettiformis]
MYGQREAGSPLHIQHFNVRGRRLLDDPSAYRSPLLEEFRSDRVRNWELKDLYGHIVEFSMDQHGSRFIQQRLETATDDERQAIFDEIMPQYALQLIQDVFGNYVIQKFLEYGTTLQKAVLVSCMQGHVLLLSLQMYGCRVVQKAVETLTPEQQSLLIRELEENVLRCVKDANGNHVIQRLLEQVEPERLTFVRFFSGHVQDLATHPYGCRVLQRCFEHLPEAHTRPLLEELQRHAIRLMQDQFGNYVIQFVLENGLEQDRLGIVAQLRGRMLQMSRHKFASNVCEKALVTADPDSRRQMIEEVMRQRQDGSSPVVTMMKDQYGNYVLQRAISVADAEQRATLIETMQPHLATLRKRTGQSRHLVAIERLLAKYSTVTEAQAASSSSETIEPVATTAIDDAPANTK